MSTNDEASRGESERTGLGAFRGVFVPSLLTILGVILFLRLGWVVGQVGLLGSIAVITLSSAITLLTALSISAIATDRPVRGGGAYYMLSRSLGGAAGGAIGVPLYLSQGLSVALYTFGFAESLVNVFPQLEVRTVALVATVAVLLLALVSAAVVARVQMAILAVVGASLVSIVAGGDYAAAGPAAETAAGAADGGGSIARLGFWSVFAVFFPAVTGIMAGVNMSGDLREPARDLPRGTLAAIGVGWFVYVGLAVVIALRASAEVLIEDTLALKKIARWDALFVAGVWGATLSSAIGSIVAAPRVLQALARDRIVPRGLRWLGHGSGAGDEPRLGVLFTAAICLAAIMLGSLEAVATLLTMFFLTTYAALNFAAGIEGALGNPSYRPRFAIPWPLPIFGGLACVAVMMLLDPLATLLAAGVVLSLIFWLHSRSVRLYWGDLRRGLWAEVTQRGLMRLQEAADPKNWRPHLLVFAGAPDRRRHLLELAGSIANRRGLLTVAAVIRDSQADETQALRTEIALQNRLQRQGLACFSRVVRASDFPEGAEQLVGAYGLGKVTPDTILVGHPGDETTHARFCRMLLYFRALGRNAIVVRGTSAEAEGEGDGDEDRRQSDGDGDGDGTAGNRRRRIDIWWGGLGRNGGLMLILGHLIRQSSAWRGAELRVRRVVEEEDAIPEARANIAELLARARVDAEVETMIPAGRSIARVLETESRDADLVMIGLDDQDGDAEAFTSAFAELDRRTADLPMTAFVMAADEVEMGEVLLDHEERAEAAS